MNSNPVQWVVILPLILFSSSHAVDADKDGREWKEVSGEFYENGSKLILITLNDDMPESSSSEGNSDYCNSEYDDCESDELPEFFLFNNGEAQEQSSVSETVYYLLKIVFWVVLAIFAVSTSFLFAVILRMAFILVCTLVLVVATLILLAIIVFIKLLLFVMKIAF